MQYICQFVFLTTTTCIHLTDVLRLQSDGTFAGYSSNFCWLEQQYWQFTAATFMNFSCTLDMIRKSTKFLDRIRTHTRFYRKTYRLRPLGHPSSLILMKKKHIINTMRCMISVFWTLSAYFMKRSTSQVHLNYSLKDVFFGYC